MNKLILVGNGFDLAHGLPTSYTHFLNNFWETLHLNIKEDSIKEIIEYDESYFGLFNYTNKPVLSFDSLIHNLSLYCNHNRFQFNQKAIHASHNLKTIFKIKNEFFRKINQKNSLLNWVDIENEYYSELKKIAKLQFSHLSETENNKTKKERVVKLNQEFEQIKNVFEEYLSKEISDKFDFNNIENPKEFIKISELLKPIIISKGPYSSNKISNLSKEFSLQDDENEIKNYEYKIQSKEAFKPIIFDSLILSFNYTPTVFSYNYYINRDFGKDICSYNYIHGELKSSENKMNFGFGDEIDNSYKEIENIGDNEYLKNFKSFQYSNTQNYDNLLRYIDSEKYQVYILGHSCGLSDRLLLNTIFEHENCRSIKVFFHESHSKDNYTDIIQNISRHFSNKKSMRRKIVSKQLSSPLPQSVRFKKKSV